MSHPAYNLPYNPAVFTARTPSSSPDCLVFPYDPKLKRFQTYSYNPHQTQNRLSHEEIENFLEQVNESSLRKWHKDNKLFYDPPCIFYFLLVLSTFILPLILIIVCYLSAAQKNVLKDLDEAIQTAKEFIRMNNSHFTNRGLRWVAPYNFPQWIELETNLRDSHAGVQNRRIDQGIPVRPQPKRPQIHTVELAQQDYQAINMPNQQGFYSPLNQQQNQFNGDMYNVNLYNK